MIKDYNSVIVPALADYIKDLFQRIARTTKGNAQISLDRYEMVDSDDTDINYLMTHGLTSSFTAKFYFSWEKEGVKYESTDELEVPKMVNSAFVVGGKLRISTNTLDNDGYLTVFNNNIRVRPDLNILFEEDPHSPGGYKLTAEEYKDVDKETYPITPKTISERMETFKLEQAQVDKIKVKLDTDNVPDYLSYDIIIRLINLGSDYKLDNLIDKKIHSPASNLLGYLKSSDVRRRIIRSMTAKYNQYNKIYLRDIQNELNQYMLVASERNIDIPSTINPLVFDSLKSKIVIPSTSMYNKSMTDIIDVVNTPINQNTNKNNELNVCADIIDDEIYIKCYRFPSQEKVTVPYTHYCTKRVLLNDDWDYDKKTFKQGKVRYKLRTKLYEGTSRDTFDYIEPQPDEKLSLTSRRVPMGNMSDSVRLGMSTGMMKQAVELVNSEVPLVTSGHDDEDIETTALMTRHNGGDAVVSKVTDGKVYLKEASGNVVFYEVPQPTPGVNNDVISFDTALKVGDRVRSGDPVVVPHVMRRNSIELGINAEAVYMNYLGYTHEDAFVISDSLSRKLTHYEIQDIYLELYPHDIVQYIKAIGSRVSSKDILVNCQTRLRVSGPIRDTYTSNSGLLQGMGISFSQNNLIVPNNIDEGYILDCRVKMIDDRQMENETTVKTIGEYERQRHSTDYDGVIPEKYKSYTAPDVDAENLHDRAAGYITIKLLVVNRGKVGDKLSNRYGSKGIVSLVLPDECMPQIEYPDGTRTHAEVLINPAALVSRKNISQLYEVSLTKCIDRIYELLQPMVQKGDCKGIRKLLQPYYGDKFDSLSDSELLEKLSEGKGALAVETGFFSKISYDTLMDWMKKLGVSDIEKIYIPDVAIAETKDGLKGFPLADYHPQEDHKSVRKYKMGYTEKPSITGKTYLMKLNKDAKYDGKVYSSVIDSREPIMGKGLYRQAGGQKIGEMELWILLETGNENFVQAQAKSMEVSQYVFLNELLLAGYTIADSGGSPLLTNYKKKLDYLTKLNGGKGR